MTLALSQTMPHVRGSYAVNSPLKDHLWFRSGGPAEILFRPADIADLQAFLADKPAQLAVTVIGVGSNLLVRDGGIAGAVIRLPASFAKIAAEGDLVRAGAAALDANVARVAADAGLGGLEFLRGIPGTIGGALRMNAGCYGREIKDVLIEATAIDGSGGLVRLAAQDMGFVYRGSAAPRDLVFVEALMQAHRDDRAAVHARMDALVQEREAAQPVRAKTGGSTFKNPDLVRSGGRKAWQLIDEAGCRGLRRGDAQVSEKHCNFLINLGSASSSDIEALGEEVRARVAARFGVELEWEIKRVGVA